MDEMSAKSQTPPAIEKSTVKFIGAPDRFSIRQPETIWLSAGSQNENAK